VDLSRSQEAIILVFSGPSIAYTGSLGLRMIPGLGHVMFAFLGPTHDGGYTGNMTALDEDFG
jgi:hypothetical protein